VKVAAELTEQRPPLVREGRLESRGCVERLGDLEELGRVEAPASSRALRPRTDVVGRADTDTRTVAQQAAGLVGLVEATGDEDRVALRRQRLGQAARRPERRVLGEALADLRELEQDEGSFVHACLSEVGPDRTPTDAPR
jgi:hypothetical protein